MANGFKPFNLTESDIAKYSLVQKCLAEVCLVEVCPAEGYPAAVCLYEVYSLPPIILPPLIPSLNTFLNNGKLFLIGHLASSTENLDN